MLAEYGYLPTRIPIGEDPYSVELRKSIPYYDQLISLIEYGCARPNISEYPQIADHIREAIIRFTMELSSKYHFYSIFPTDIVTK